ncbi:MAG: hypothetical protein EBS53_17740, partial [Bacteroidetes bacterium]|nr:hypothetical protein [Bacteroidota bacterium]
DGAGTAEGNDRFFRGYVEFKDPFPVGAEVFGSEGTGIDPDLFDKDRQQVPFPDRLAFSLDDPDLRPGMEKNPVGRHGRITSLIPNNSSLVGTSSWLFVRW